MPGSVRRPPSRANPQSYSSGVEICEDIARIPFNDVFKFKHRWLRTKSKEAGLGQEGGGVPGEGEFVTANNSPYWTQTEVVDHTGRGNLPGSTCRRAALQSDCVNKMLSIGHKHGTFSATNNCQSFVFGVIAACPAPSSVPQPDMTSVALPRSR